VKLEAWAVGITAGSREVPGRKGLWQETSISYNNNNNNNNNNFVYNSGPWSWNCVLCVCVHACSAHLYVCWGHRGIGCRRKLQNIIAGPMFVIVMVSVATSSWEKSQKEPRNCPFLKRIAKYKSVCSASYFLALCHTWGRGSLEWS